MFANGFNAVASINRSNCPVPVAFGGSNRTGQPVYFMISADYEPSQVSNQMVNSRTFSKIT